MNRLIRVGQVAQVLFLASFMAIPAMGADLQWSGEYRAEGTYIKNFTLSNSAGVEDSYIQDHLILEPKIIATDGLNIKGRFDILNNALANNMGGQIFGDYTGPTGPTTVGGPSPQPPAVLTQTEQPETLVVNGLYLNWVNEFGALIVGRVPFQFGLGMTYSSGDGIFDHYITTKDMVGYKLVLGNISIMPAYAKVREGVLTNEDDINDFMAVAEYNNPESDLSMGVMFSNRVAPQDGSAPVEGNDFPPSYFTGVNPNYGAVIQDPGGSGFNAYNLNFFVKKKSDNFDFGAEAGFMNGYSGLQILNNSTGADERINFASFGIATETTYRTGDFTLNLKAGMASGDDPDTASVEGYAFNPNYNVAMMMFNYPVGSPGYDALRTSLYGSRVAYNSTNPQINALSGLDTEVISNAVYVAPNVKWAAGEHYDISANFCYGLELKPPFSSSNATYGNIGSSLGFETDLGFTFHPSDKFTWETLVGALFPGSAFAAGNANLPTSVAYGATTKAAISF